MYFNCSPGLIIYFLLFEDEHLDILQTLLFFAYYALIIGICVLSLFAEKEGNLVTKVKYLFLSIEFKQRCFQRTIVQRNRQMFCPKLLSGGSIRNFFYLI